MTLINDIQVDLEASWALWMTARNAQGKLTQGETWRRQNPGEWDRLSRYVVGTGPRPTLASITGQKMLKEVDAMLKAKGGNGDQGGGGTPDPDFGTSLPERLPDSTGTNYYVSPSGSNSNDGLSTGAPWLTIAHAYANVSLAGGIINLMDGTHTADASDITWTRDGNSDNPVTLRANPGDSPVVSGSRFLVSSGSYIRFHGFTATGSGSDGFKADVGSHHIEWDGMTISDCAMQGILLGADGDQITDIQVWNTRITGAGDGVSADDQHGIYAKYIDGLVIANCLIYDYQGYGIHFFASSGAIENAIVTCCTVDESWEDGGPVAFALTPLNIRMEGLLLTNSISGYEGIRVWNATESGSVVADCIAFDVTAPAFPTTQQGGGSSVYTQINNSTEDPDYVNAATRDYHLQAGSPAIDNCAARPEWVPATDIDGDARVTADAGCFAYLP